ncbi:MAG: hypothetical protein V9E87_01935 [Gemmatimonadales bacterium]
MSGPVIAEGIALVIDLSAAGVGAVDNVIQLLNSQGPLAAASASASLIASVTAPIPGVGAATNTVSLTLTLVKGAAYADENGASLGDYVSAIGSVVSIVGSLLAIGTPLGWTALGIAAVGSTLTAVGFGLNLRDLKNSAASNKPYLESRGFSLAKDPLTLDLDADGIEATAIDISAPVLFDHDADGIRVATGWIGADDALVVLDLNGNGLIDSGRELFGDNTLITSGFYAGNMAANGYEALAQHDTNHDGQINSADAVYGELRLWQDANQDGISQSSELKTLPQSGIGAIGVQAIPSNINLGNGNTQPFSGSFTRINGQPGQSGTPELSGSLLLASNNFYREFTDDPNPTAAATALPQVGGSGWARDLREAMSLGTPQAQALQDLVAQFAAATTRGEQRALLDDLVAAWGRTSGRMLESIYVYGFNGTTVEYSSGDLLQAKLTIHPAGMEVSAFDPLTGLTGNTLTPEGVEVLRRLNVLEVFNGEKFIEAGLPSAAGAIRMASGGGSGGGGSGQEATGPRYNVTLHAPQIAALNASYDALSAAVYSALVTQTRLKPYLDSIELVIDESGLRFRHHGHAGLAG